MKKLLFLTLLVLVGSTAANAQCNAQLWRRVYNPSPRFGTPPKHECKRIEGVIHALAARTYPDGDLHIQFEVDPRYRSLLRASNHGFLTLEVVCVDNTPTSPQDARRRCRGYTNPAGLSRARLYRLKRDRVHVRVWGELVHDNEKGHGGHTELHPVSRIERYP